MKITKKITDRYLNHIRSIHCLIAGCSNMDTDPDHLQARGMGGIGKGGTSTGTIIDFYTVPLCRFHHSERHNSGMKKFEKDHNINLWREVASLSTRYLLINLVMEQSPVSVGFAHKDTKNEREDEGN